MIEMKDSLLIESFQKACNDIEFFKNMFVKEKGKEKAEFLQKLENKLLKKTKEQDLIKDEFNGQVEELKMNAALHSQIIKNSSNVGLLYDSANDLDLMKVYKESSKNELVKIDRKT
jgi:hypothetical protein